MLIRFGAKNFRSMRERQELSLVASALKDEQADLFTNSLLRYALLPAAVIYGANASGKTTILEALRHLRMEVIHSHTGRQPEEPIPRQPFLLDEESQATDTELDAEFLVDGVRYSFGFAYNDDHYTKEWLYAYPKGTQQIWYEREGREPFYFGKSLKGPLRTIESLTRPNSLFISAAAQNNNDQITPLFNYLRSIRFFNNVINSIPKREQVDPHRLRIVDFLKTTDAGVMDLHFDPIPESPEDLEIKSTIRRALSSLMEQQPKVRAEITNDSTHLLSLLHSGKGSYAHDIPFTEESRGTMRAISLLPRVFDALDAGTVLIVDELDASLHTVIAEKIVAMFNEQASNPKGAQLIATTHDTNLLVGDVLRRDQIWFTEKSRAGETHLYPLTDIRTRNTDNLEKGYLEGRFGAIPMRTSIRRFRRKVEDAPKG